MALHNMSITYTWSILGVFTEKEYHQYTDFIYACQWQITGTTEEKSQSISDRIGFSLPNQNYQFTPRSEMTEDQIIEWVKLELGSEKISELQNQIAELLNS